MPSVCGEREHSEGTVDPGKLQQNCALPGRGFLRPVAERGGGIAFNPSQRGAGGSTIQGVQGGKATRHHTTPHPFQTAPDRTTTHQSPTHRHSTRHLTTPGAPEHHTRHYPKNNTNRSPPTKNTPFSARTLHPFGMRAPLYSSTTPRQPHPPTLHPFGTRAPLYSKMTT